jgi:hypothetical protein
VRTWDFHELDAVAVDADSDQAGMLGAVRLDVDVRGAALGRFEDELIGQLDDAGIGLVDLVSVFFLLFGAPLPFSELVEDLGQVDAVGRRLLRFSV